MWPPELNEQIIQGQVQKIVIFVIFIVVGAVSKLSDVLDFSDAMIFSMAFPNIVGSIFLAPKVLKKVRAYWERYQSGEMNPVESN